MKKLFFFFMAVFICSIMCKAFAQTPQVPQLQKKTKQSKPTLNSIDKPQEKESALIRQWEEAMAAAGDNAQYDTVVVYAGKILSKKPTNANALYELGHSFKERNMNLDSAKKLYELTILNDPKYFRAYGELAVLLNAGGNVDQAIEMAKKGIEVGTLRRDNMAIAYKNLGGYFNTAAQYDSAITAYKNAITINPQYCDAYYDLGYANNKSKKYNDAADAFEHVVALAPADEKQLSSSLKYLSWYYRGNKGSNMTKAVQFAEQGIKLNPGEKEFVYTLAEKYRNDGNWYSFIEVYKGLSNADQNNNSAPYNVAYGYQQIHNDSEMIEWFKIAARRGNSDAQNVLRNAGVSW
jgi:tetratricopeptide (TPR) repeat protein